MNPNFLASSTKQLSDEIMQVERTADEERITDAKLKASVESLKIQNKFNKI